jgi:large subunit ribosomal protein L30
MKINWIMVVQTGSPIRRHHTQRETLIGLGLNGIRRGRLLPDTPEIRGMIRKVSHLVHVLDDPLMGALTPTMKKELDVLRRFNRRVTRTEQSAFWRRYADQIPNVISRVDNMRLQKTGPMSFMMKGTIHSSLEDFDQDEIAAFVLDYRQYTQNNDAISISSLAGIYRRAWMHSGARKNFEEIRARFNRELDALSSLRFGDYHMSVRDLVDIVVYGGLAHSNSEKAEIFESWDKSGIMGMVWGEFFAAMRGLMQTLKQLRTLNEQVLSVADPAPHAFTSPRPSF